MWTKHRLIDGNEGVEIKGITLDDQGNVFFITERTLQKIDADNNVTTLWKAGANTQLAGLVWNGSNSLYFCNSRNNSIRVFDIHTRMCLTSRSNMDNAFFYLTLLAIRRYSNSLRIYDSGYLRKMNLKTGRVKQVFAKDSAYPTDSVEFGMVTSMAMDDDGTFYLCDVGSQCIWRIKDGIADVIASQSTASIKSVSKFTLTELHNPLAWSKDGFLLFVDDGKLKRLGFSKDIWTMSEVPCSIQDIQHIAVKDETSILLATKTKIFRLCNMWRWERWLWIGHLKEQASYCTFAQIPKDVVRAIALQF